MTTKMKKNLKQRKPSVGSSETETRGLSRYDIEVKIGELTSPSASQENTPSFGEDGKQPTTPGKNQGSIAEANIRQQTGTILAGSIAEANSLHLVRLFRGITKQGQPCIKVVMLLSPNGEWELNGNEIRFVGN